MSYVITKAAPEDAEELLRLLRTIGAESDNLTFGAEGLPVTTEQEREFLAAKLESSHSLMLVVKKDGEIVGNASFDSSPHPRLAHRGRLAISVLRSEWGNGVGTMLMEEIISFARNTAKVQILSLEVRSDNARAIRLYEKFGFQKTGIFPGMLKINGELIDCDLMTLQL